MGTCHQQTRTDRPSTSIAYRLQFISIIKPFDTKHTDSLVKTMLLAVNKFDGLLLSKINRRVNHLISYSINYFLFVSLLVVSLNNFN